MPGARTPEELETLLEDAFVLHDQKVLGQLFEPEAVLHVAGSREHACGRRQIERLITTMWNHERTYLADPHTVHQVQGIALVVSGRAINVVRRGDDALWRYTILFLADGLWPWALPESPEASEPLMI